MKDEKVTFEMVFHIEPYRNFKLGYEGSLGPDEIYGEAVIKAFQKVMHGADKVYAELRLPISSTSSLPNNSSPAPIPEIPVEKPIPEDQILANTLASILNCKSLEGDDGLLSFESFVRRENKPDITGAYNLMLKKLSK